MKLRVEQWERVWSGDDYEDVYHDLGVKNFTLEGCGDNTVVRLDDLLITGVFGLQVTDDYIEFGGFCRPAEKPLLFVRYRLFAKESKYEETSD